MTSDRSVPGPVPFRVDDAALLTDLYEITMAASYWREGMTGLATFSLFVRGLPPGRGYLVAAGLEDALTALQSLHFSPAARHYLGSLGRFDTAFLEALAGIGFTGSVRAVPEGTLVFPDEPLIEVTAPILEAQLVESLVLNTIHYQTLVATKAARCVDAAEGRSIIEFGLRRAPGLDAALKAARAAWIAGAAATSNTLAGRWLGIPVTGTMAHSYVTAFPSELDAFRAFARAFPTECILLIDTFDTVVGARKAVIIGQELAAAGYRLKGVRLDSGDLMTLSRDVRHVLDEGGMTEAQIIASGGLDEEEIVRLVRAGAPVDAFGVGTRMDVSADAPYLDMAYKLVRYEDRDLLKLSGRKRTWPGAKQVWRGLEPGGHMTGDILGLASEPGPDGMVPLLDPVLTDGSLREPGSLDAARERCRVQRAALPPETRRLRAPRPYEVRKSPALRHLTERATADLRQQELDPWR